MRGAAKAAIRSSEPDASACRLIDQPQGASTRFQACIL